MTITTRRDQIPLIEKASQSIPLSPRYPIGVSRDFIQPFWILKQILNFIETFEELQFQRKYSIYWRNDYIRFT
jgi:hypothetical protein